MRKQHRTSKKGNRTPGTGAGKSNRSEERAAESIEKTQQTEAIGKEKKINLRRAEWKDNREERR